MVNLHLLQRNLTVEEYNQEIMLSIRENSEWQRLPTYVIARCPFCSTKNIERLDTYTIRRWRGRIDPVSDHVFYHSLVSYHCPHFALAQIFFDFHNNLEFDKIRGSSIAGKTKPYVIGHLLESGRCQAVMHALPICRIENDTFVPSYTLFIISYFSERPKEARRDVEKYNQYWAAAGEATLYLPLQFGDSYWADLPRWVAAGQLHWVDGDDPELNIRTHDVSAFPYGNISS